jgi:hypothetical protein
MNASSSPLPVAAASPAAQARTWSRRTRVLAVRLACWLAGIAALLSVPLAAADPLYGWAVHDPPFTSLTYGIQTFLWWDEGSAGLHMDWVQRMVFSHVKQTFAWEDVQPEPDVWQFGRADVILGDLERRNLQLVVRLTDTPAWAHSGTAPGSAGVVDTPPDDPATFSTYCGAIAARYAGRIAAYQVWNEPNLSREWGGRVPDAAGYVRLLAACSTAIRAADPNAVIISAGLAPTGNHDATALPDDLYLQQMYDAGFAQYVDVVGVHAPGYTPPHVAPEDAPGGNRFFAFRRVEDLRRIMIANGDAARQMAILETGYTTDTVNPSMMWFAVSEAEQARLLVQAYEYAAWNWTPWVGLMSAIYIANPAWTPANEEYWWAITTPDNYTRPAYIELANMAKYCGDDYRPPRDPGSPEAIGLAPVHPCA